jgi:hypothetical protein
MSDSLRYPSFGMIGIASPVSGWQIVEMPFGYLPPGMSLQNVFPKSGLMQSEMVKRLTL